jgi:Tfp pilus assembly protein PilO
MKPVHKKFLITLGLIWGCSMVLLAAAYVCVSLPQKKALTAIEAKLSERSLAYDISKEANSKRSIDERQAQIDMLIDKLTIFVANSFDLDNLTFDISEVAEVLNVNSFSSKGSGSDVFVEIPNCGYIGYSFIEIEFTGSFNDFAIFINEMERHKPIIFINEFNITNKTNQNGNNKASLLLAVLVQDPESTTEEEKMSGLDS